MKKLLSTLALSLSAIITTTAMAAPQHDPRQGHVQPPKPPTHQNFKYQQQNDRFDRNDRFEKRDRHDNRFNQQRVNPSKDWRSGQSLPKQFSSSRFEVNHREAQNLSKTNKNQQWYKINGDYVLVNEKNNKIIRILG